MSRKTIYQDQKLILVGGRDHMFGDFLQLYDKTMESETREGEGLIFDWSQGFGTEINLTDIDGSKPMEICIKYIKDNKNEN